jgi:hypothetical protein
VGKEYDATAEDGSLDGFLQQISLLSDADSIRDDEGLLTLMTLHNAKGLEFPIVFILGCEDGVFPHSRALDEGGLEEERRLAYVGITRAMRDLYLTYARTRNVFGARTYGLRSRFLDEIPSELTDAESHVRVGVGSGPARAAETTWAAARSDDAPAPDFRLGDDVNHAAFGEGVVTGIEPGGIVVVRFAGDGSERKLMAAYARSRRDRLERDAYLVDRVRRRRRRVRSAAPVARRGRRVTATIIDGREIARQVREEVAREVAELVAGGGPPPGLATILVGADPGSEIYVAGKQKASREVGIEPFDHRPPADASHEDVAALIAELNADPAVSGILLQIPVPDHLDGPALTELIDPAKDVDGLTPINAGTSPRGSRGCGRARRRE